MTAGCQYRLVTVVFLLELSILLANEPCRDPGGGFSHNTQLQLHQLNLPDGVSDAPTCFDGSRPGYYYRPCCDGQDPMDFCNASGRTATWFIVFENNGWCFSEESCSARPRSYSSSEHLPHFFPQSLDGIFSIAGEQNPNFYKSYVAFVPQCSNDMFLSSCLKATKINSFNKSETPSKSAHKSRFCGQDIARAVVTDLASEISRYGESNVVFVGGAGIMMMVPELAKLLPTSASVKALCDGCILLNAKPLKTGLLSDNDERACTSDNCSLNATLNANTLTHWKSTSAIDLSALYPPHLISTFARNDIELVAVQPLLDNITLSRLGAWPAEPTNKAWQTYTSQIANMSRNYQEAAPYTFAPSCTGPHSGSLLDSWTTFSTRAPHEGSFPFGLTNILYDLLRNPQANYSRAFDTCTAMGCNPTCPR